MKRTIEFLCNICFTAMATACLFMMCKLLISSHCVFTCIHDGMLYVIENKMKFSKCSERCLHEDDDAVQHLHTTFSFLCIFYANLVLFSRL